MYRPLLDIILVNALTLQTTPERCTTELLYIELKRTSHKDIPRYFTVEKTSCFSIAEAKQANFGLVPDKSMFDVIFEKAPLIRADGGIGVALAIIHVKEVDITQMTPTILRSSLADAPRYKQWASILIDRVAAGQFD